MPKMAPNDLRDYMSSLERYNGKKYSLLNLMRMSGRTEEQVLKDLEKVAKKKTKQNAIGRADAERTEKLMTQDYENMRKERERAELAGEDTRRLSSGFRP